MSARQLWCTLPLLLGLVLVQPGAAAATVVGARTSSVFSNPVIPGFASDPSIVRVGDDFYLVNSTFEYFPGIPVYHSRDLVNWTMIGHAMSDPGFGSLWQTESSGGIQAATIRYHNGLFYIVATSIVDRDWVSFVVTAADPKGPWSAPHIIKGAIGIDPSLFFDDDGKAWYTANGARMESPPPAETGIWVQEFDLKSLELIGPRQFIWNGCCGGASIEGPHVYKRKGFYYLLVAEGGTGFEHSVSIAISKNVTGPYISDPRNPVLTDRHLGYDYPISGVGHADLVELNDGRWYSVALGWRVLDGQHAMLGRETFLVPVIWKAEREPWVEPKPDYPVFSAGTGKMELHYPMPFAGTRQATQQAFYDDFTGGALAAEWNFRRPPVHPFASLTASPGTLRLELQPGFFSERAQYSFVGIRQRQFRFEASVEMSFRPAGPSEEAGLAVLQNDRAVYMLTLGAPTDGASSTGPVLRLQSVLQGKTSLLATAGAGTSKVHLKVVGDYAAYQFYYSLDGRHWLPLGGALDSRELSPNRLPGFNYTGANVGLYATSKGLATTSHADFGAFSYRPLDGNRDAWFHCYADGAACTRQ